MQGIQPKTKRKPPLLQETVHYYRQEKGRLCAQPEKVSILNRYLALFFNF